MIFSLILAAGIGQRMRNSGVPKQFIKVNNKPIILHTIEKFMSVDEIDENVIVCREGYVELIEDELRKYHTSRNRVITGGDSRQTSLQNGIDYLKNIGAKTDDIVLIHDGVRPLVSIATICENIRVARMYGCAITVHPVVESVVITGTDKAGIEDFKPRKDTFTLTSPQTFCFGDLWAMYKDENIVAEYKGVPLLDAAMVYASRGGIVHLVKEQNKNIKITTPEDVYYLKAIMEMEENKTIFGI